MTEEQPQENLPANEEKSTEYYKIVLYMQEGEGGKKVNSVEIVHEEKKDRASRIMDFLKEMLSIKEEEMKAATSSHANSPEEATKQRAMFYYFQSIVKGAENIK